MLDDKMQQINCRVPPVVYKRLTEMASKASTPLGTYASSLLQAAYAARAKPPTGDRDLDTQVGVTILLWGEGRDTQAIAEAVGLKEATVRRVIKAWRADVLGRAA